MLQPGWTLGTLCDVQSPVGKGRELYNSTYRRNYDGKREADGGCQGLGRQMENRWLMGTVFQFCKMKKRCRPVTQQRSIVNPTELDT